MFVGTSLQTAEMIGFLRNSTTLDLGLNLCNLLLEFFFKLRMRSISCISANSLLQLAHHTLIKLQVLVCNTLQIRIDLSMNFGRNLTKRLQTNVGLWGSVRSRGLARLVIRAVVDDNAT